MNKLSTLIEDCNYTPEQLTAIGQEVQHLGLILAEGLHDTNEDMTNDIDHEAIVFLRCFTDLFPNE